MRRMPYQVRWNIQTTLVDLDTIIKKENSEQNFLQKKSFRIGEIWEEEDSEPSDSEDAGNLI
jgi:hypothetical protein